MRRYLKKPKKSLSFTMRIKLFGKLEVTRESVKVMPTIILLNLVLEYSI